MTLHRPHGTLSTSTDVIHLTPEQADWTYTGLRVLKLAAGAGRTIETGEFEAFVLPLAGSLVVEVDGERFELQGRDSVFTRVTDFAYVPRDASVILSSVEGCEVALPMARCENRLTPKYGPADAVPVEARGSGNATRHVTNFGVPGVWDHADKLNACELITPDGNWSSYPPHKHDENRPGEETALEEIYYFEIDGPHGFGYQRVSPSREGVSEVLAEVRSGDAVLVPDGWHGPSIAQPGHSMYYLNVMAGPGSERQWRICFHPDHTEGYR
jgi:5-deoxy-glucuronate isomerase